LAAERAGYVRAHKGEKLPAIDVEMAGHGWCVSTDGELVKVEDKPVKALKERAVRKAPENTKAE
jgi:hypothetical protein